MNREIFKTLTLPWSVAQTAANPIRRVVFIEEQGVPQALEWDGEDDGYSHILAYNAQDQAVGTARFNQTGHIGRMAVLKPWRGRGVGSTIMHGILIQAQALSIVRFSLNAQLEAVPFYNKFGFVESGPIFTDAGIKHRKMAKPYSSKSNKR